MFLEGTRALVPGRRHPTDSGRGRALTLSPQHRSGVYDPGWLTQAKGLGTSGEFRTFLLPQAWTTGKPQSHSFMTEKHHENETPRRGGTEVPRAIIPEGPFLPRFNPSPAP